MYCTDCKAQWPGHTQCPECNQPLVSLAVFQSEIHIDALPQFDDLKAFFKRGKASKIKTRASSNNTAREP